MFNFHKNSICTTTYDGEQLAAYFLKFAAHKLDSQNLWFSDKKQRFYPKIIIRPEIPDNMHNYAWYQLCMWSVIKIERIVKEMKQRQTEFSKFVIFGQKNRFYPKITIRPEIPDNMHN